MILHYNFVEILTGKYPYLRNVTLLGSQQLLLKYFFWPKRRKNLFLFLSKTCFMKFSDSKNGYPKSMTQIFLFDYPNFKKKNQISKINPIFSTVNFHL